MPASTGSVASVATPAADAASRRPDLTLIAVAGLTLLALALRLPGVGQSLFGDELFLWSAVHDHALHDVYVTVRETEKTPPLGFVLGWLFARGGHADTLVRVPSLVAGVAAVPLVFALGARSVGRPAALVAAAWIAISPFQIFYGSETRAYAQVTTFVVLSTLALLLALEDGRRRWWVLYAAAAAAAIYSHYIAVIILAPQAVWALWTHRDRWREQLAAGAAVALAFLPWVPSFLEQARNSGDEARRIDLISPLTPSNLAETWTKTFVGHPYDALRDQPGRLVVVVLGVGLALLLLALAAGGDRARRPGLRLPKRGGLLLALAFAAPVVIVLYSLRPDKSFLLARNLSVSVPYAVLLIGWALTALRPRAAAAVSAAALAVLAVGTVRTLAPERQRTDARDAAHWVDAHAPPGAPLVDVPGPHAIRTYLEKPRNVSTIAEFGPQQWAAAARRRTPVFVSYPKAGGIEALLVPPAKEAPGYRLVAEHTSPGVPYRIGIREFAPQ
jgi:4-amino-4-deoxy-L-arabinose transferase-like glycosyltransferase